MITPYVLGFAFYRDSRKVVLIRKIKPAWQCGKLNGVGGKIERGEHCNDAMAREFKEETGCDTFCTDWVKFTELHFSDAIVYCFATSLPYHKRVATTTEEKILVCSVDDLPEDLLPNLAWLLPMALYTIDNPVTNEVPHTLYHA